MFRKQSECTTYHVAINFLLNTFGPLMLKQLFKKTMTYAHALRSRMVTQIISRRLQQEPYFAKEVSCYFARHFAREYAGK